MAYAVLIIAVVGLLASNLVTYHCLKKAWKREDRWNAICDEWKRVAEENEDAAQSAQTALWYVND